MLNFDSYVISSDFFNTYICFGKKKHFVKHFFLEIKGNSGKWFDLQTICRKCRQGERDDDPTFFEEKKS